MNAYNGQIYELPSEVGAQAVYGQPITWPMLDVDLTAKPVAELESRTTRESQLAALRAALDRKEALVAVSGDVAQRLRLGDRELARRARRR